MAKSLVEMCAQIVAAQASHQPMEADDIMESLRTVFRTLQDLQEVANGVESAKPGVPRADMDTADNTLAYLRQNPLKSIQRNQVICLESGKAYKVLSNRHLALYGLTSREYKKKWGIPLRTPLSARSLSAKRRKMAKERGLGQHLVAWRAQRARQQAETEEAS